MNSVKKRNLFLLVISVLILVLVVISVAVAMRGPRTSPVEVVSKGKDGTLPVSYTHLDVYKRQQEQLLPF